MQHPNTDTIYCLSYPRSGSTWFRYCLGFITEIDTENNKESLYHSHSCDNDAWTLKNTYDIKNILLLRNYKEAIFSELNNIYSRHPIAIFVKLLTHIGDNPGILSKHEFDELDHGSWINWKDLSSLLLAFKIKQYVNDFLVPSFPEFSYGSASPTGDNPTGRYDQTASLSRSCPDWYLEQPLRKPAFYPPPPYIKPPPSPLQYIDVMRSSLVHQYHFALQLKNYYELLEYHDNVASLNPDNALIIRYEDLMQNPLFELNKVIDFMDKNHCTTPEQINSYRDKLHMLIANITNHKLMSINQYRSQGHMATSYKQDSAHDYHRQMGQKVGLWDKSFLLDTDRVLKNKNLELFSKYLSDYEETGN